MTNLIPSLLWAWLPWALVVVWLLWALYVLTMGLYRAKLAGRLHGLARVMGMPLVALAFALDIVVNKTIASVLFLEWPKETLVTSRLQRHIASGSGWRFKLANAICNQLLDPFDPKGQHCQ